jgi:hypothetical protein
MDYPHNAWLWLDELLGHNDNLTEELHQLHHRACLSELVPRLRVLDVVIWMRHWPTHLPVDCPGMN